MKAVTWEDIEQELERLPVSQKRDDICAFGAGLLGKNSVPLLRQEGIEVCAFSDNDRGKWDKKFEGLPCVRPQEIAAYEHPFALVTAIRYYPAISRQLEEMGIPHCTLDAYVVRNHLSDFYEVYCLLDEESRRIYAGVLLGRITGDLSVIRPLCSDAQYFALPEFRFCGINEVFVDCGAFTGENSQTFIRNVQGVFQKIYAFEGNPAALAAMGRRFAHERELWLFREDQIVREQKFVGAADGLKIPFHITEDNPTNSFAAQESGQSEWVEAITLDRYFAQRGEDRITFLKADIEGAEWDMLHGAEQMIRRSRPKIAISIYHTIYDFIRIPLLLKEWVPEYHFAVRHHWYSFDETVLYCYV